jgi:hypothetical protein
MRTIRIVNGGQPAFRTEVDDALSTVLATAGLMGVTLMYKDGTRITYTAWEYPCHCGVYNPDHDSDACPTQVGPDEGDTPDDC